MQYRLCQLYAVRSTNYLLNASRYYVNISRHNEYRRMDLL